MARDSPEGRVILRVVIDTHVFLWRIIPHEEDVYDAFVEKCNAVVVNRKIKNEYTGRAHSHGYRSLDILIALIKLNDKAKLIWKGISACRKIKVENRQIKKDAHLIQAAAAANAEYIITEDWTDLLDYKEKIQREFHIDVVTPDQFLESNAL